MDYKLILETQALLENGTISWVEFQNKLCQAGVTSYNVDLNSKRIVYEDEFGQDINLPLSK